MELFFFSDKSESFSCLHIYKDIIDRVNLALSILGTHFYFTRRGGIVTSTDKVFLFFACGFLLIAY